MKNYKIKNDDIKQLINIDGPQGAIATDRITVDGCKVCYMYREEAYDIFPDSGWRFFSGDEDEDYINNSDNSGVYNLNTICNYDKDIIPFLDAPVGSSFIRNENGIFIEDNKKEEE